VAASVGDRLVQAIAHQDSQALAECFTSEAEFRALVPPGLRERQGADEAAALISAWFGDSTELELLESTTVELADRLHVTYRFQGVENGEPYIVEQHLFCTLAEDRIARADLLCSGFRPR
jgi:SnoaL-like protein